MPSNKRPRHGPQSRLQPCPISAAPKLLSHQFCLMPVVAVTTRAVSEEFDLRFGSGHVSHNSGVKYHVRGGANPATLLPLIKARTGVLSDTKTSVSFSVVRLNSGAATGKREHPPDNCMGGFVIGSARR